MTIGRRARVLVSLALCLFAKSGACDASPAPGGTVISNVAEATFKDASGNAYDILSNAVTVTVAAVGALVVAPKETGCNPATDTFSLGAPLVRTFTINNTSNITDAYTIQSASTSAGNVTAIDFLTSSGPMPVALGSTVSPNVAPGSSIVVQVTVATSSIAPGTDVEIALSARTTAGGTENGLQTDSGDQCAIAAAGPKFGGPGGANTQPQKFVNGGAFAQSAAGAVVHYSIAFENYGAMPALAASLSDTLPQGVTPVATSVLYDGVQLPAGAVSVAGQQLTVALGSIPSNVLETVTFDASVSSAAVLGATFVNVATLSASNAPAANTTPAVVFVGTANIVFDGNAGGTSPIAGATLTLLGSNNQPIMLAGGSGTNAQTTGAQNPVVTGSDGSYAFPLTASQLGTPAKPATYTLTISAANYKARRIGLKLTPDPTGSVYALDATALDAQPLAVPGSFALVQGTTHYADLYGFFGNLPIFAQQTIDVRKSADRSVASGGDRVIFTVAFSPASSTPLGATTVVDTLPAGFAYAPGTGRLDGAIAEPAVRGDVLTWTLPSLTATHTIAYATVVAPGIQPDTQATNVVTVSAKAPNDPVPVSARADASVAIVAGVFSDHIVITGRAYIDRSGVARFTRGDLGVAGVRIYLEDGESVVTDPDGRYTFPGVRPGMHVLRLDETTLPPRVKAFADRALDSDRSTRRLVHGVMDALTMQNVDFALQVAP
jgi:uncharacterized repeat protein (TIGR01451 family)